MRVLFAGSPSIAIPALKALSLMEQEGEGVILAGILTSPDSRRGRGSREEPGELSLAASDLDAARQAAGLLPLPQLKPAKLDAAARAAAAACKADLLVSFAYGRLFGPRFLALFPQGGINVHPSLLPQYRGASPLQAAIRGQLVRTGVTVQKLAAQMDAGDILAQEGLDISSRETAASLSGRAALLAARLLAETLADFPARAGAARPQEGEPSYCRPLSREDGQIDWGASAESIDAQIRACTPWPLSFTSRGKDILYILEAAPFDAPAPPGAPVPPAGTPPPGTVIAVEKGRGILIQTGKGLLAVTRLQWQARKALDWQAFCNGARDFITTRLGTG
jgi:methionyl-tRNA formyltransferase